MTLFNAVFNFNQRINSYAFTLLAYDLVILYSKLTSTINSYFGYIVLVANKLRELVAKKNKDRYMN